MSSRTEAIMYGVIVEHLAERHFIERLNEMLL
jgi:hypothetical protein